MKAALVTLTLMLCGRFGVGRSEKTYYQQASPMKWERTSTAVAPITMTTANRLGCAHECALRKTCFSFDWDDASQICSVDTWHAKSSSTADPDDFPKLYRTSCPLSKGYVIRSSSVKGRKLDQCVWISKIHSNVLHNGTYALETCSSNDGYLFNVESELKRDVLHYLHVNEIAERWLWVGLTVVGSTREAMWSNGLPLDLDWAPRIYHNGLPQYHNPTPDFYCSSYDSAFSRMSLFFCWRWQLNFICEYKNNFVVQVTKL